MRYRERYHHCLSVAAGLFAAAGAVACNEPSRSAAVVAPVGAPAKSPVVEDRRTPAPEGLPTTAGSPVAAPSTLTYVSTRGDGVGQKLRVHFVDETHIQFLLVLSGKCTRRLKGTATGRPGDPEIDEDEQGIAYPANEFRHEAADGCGLAIRIAAQDRRRAIVHEWGCGAACGTSPALMQVAKDRETGASSSKIR